MGIIILLFGSSLFGLPESQVKKKQEHTLKEKLFMFCSYKRRVLQKICIVLERL